MYVFLLLSGIVSWVVGVFLFLEYQELEKNRSLLDKDGVETKAYVVSKDIEETERMLHSTRRFQTFSSYHLLLRYDARSSQKGTLSFNKALRGESQDFDLSTDYRTVSTTVSSNMHERISIGDKLSVKYLVADPQVVEVLNADGSYGSNRKHYGAIFMFAFGALCLFLSLQYFIIGKSW